MNYKRNRTKLEKIVDCLDNHVRDLHPILYNELFELLIARDDITNVSKCKRFVVAILGLPATGKQAKQYWLKRGWNEQETYFKVKLYKKSKVSPFSREFWTNKINPNTGRFYTTTEADYERNSRRPIRKEYWMKQGHTEKESIQLAYETKQNNNKLGNANFCQVPREIKKYKNKKCIEYWLSLGVSEQEAIEIISESQKTFSLDQCIERYGKEEGLHRWKLRQEKWQTTLNNKSQEELDEINKKKTPIRTDLFDTIENCIESLRRTRNITLFDNIDDFLADVNIKIEQNPYLRYYSIEEFIAKKISKIQFEIFQRLNVDVSTALVGIIGEDSKYRILKGNKRPYNKRTSNGLLRSSYEIYFYESFTTKYPSIELVIDKRYPNSNYRFDFSVNGVFIEICPMFDTNKSYRDKIIMKQQKFGSILLKDIKQIDAFINSFNPKL